MLRACGRRVGLFTSPHLLRYNERVQIDGVPVQRGGAGRGLRAHRGGARRDHADLLRIQHARGAGACFAMRRCEAGCWRWGWAGASMPPTSSMPMWRCCARWGWIIASGSAIRSRQIGAEKAGIFRAAPAGGAGQCRRCPQSVWRAIESSSAAPSPPSAISAGASMRPGCEASAGITTRRAAGSSSCRRPALRGRDPVCATPPRALTALQLLAGARVRCDAARVAQALRAAAAAGSISDRRRARSNGSWMWLTTSRRRRCWRRPSRRDRSTRPHARRGRHARG